MRKLNIFQITLANSNGIFNSGSIVQGHVTIELLKPMKMRGIKLKFKGKAKVHWTEERTETRDSGNVTVTDHYKNDETYFKQELYLFGNWASQCIDGASELRGGRHTFPFNFQLPQNLPSSFESRYGKVRYQVTCKIDKPWKKDHKTEKPFTVISMLDLNSSPNYCQRLQGANRKHLCCLCCKSGPIEASLFIDRQGFVPGEAMTIFADISNGASRDMAKSYVDFKMITKFHGHGHSGHKTKTQRKEIARLTHGGIPGYGEEAWTGEKIVIPPLPPSFLAGCNIIDIQYIVKLNVDPSGLGFELEVPLEIVIGTIPLMQVVEALPPSAPPGFEHSAPAGPGGYMYPLYVPPPYMPNLPPPSYMESITGKYDSGKPVNDRTLMHGDTSFAPSYPYYNWGHTPAELPPQQDKLEDR